MTINLITSHSTQELKLETYIMPARQVVWVGAKDEKVYNTIVVDCADTFLLTIAYDAASDTWLLTPGQVRTECSRGLKSNRSKACSMCRGCCGYIRTANPDYSLRIPQSTVLLNGQKVVDEGAILHEGDNVSFE